MGTVNRARSARRRRILLAMEMSGETVERRAGIAQYAREAGWILESRYMAFPSPEQRNEYLASINIEGIIARIRQFNPEIRDLVESATVPVVDLWPNWPEFEVTRVLPDYAAGGAMAANHLLDIGIRRVLFYSHTADYSAAHLRRNGCRAAVTARGAAVDEIWWDSREPTCDGLGRISWLAGKLKGVPTPFGVVAANDFIACDVVDAAEQNGLRVPDDVAIIGADNDPVLTELGAVPLSSVDLARRHLGYQAAALLDRMIDGEPPPDGPLLIAPAGVVVRRSTEVIAVSDAEVQAAARYISKHFKEPIAVTDVVANSSLSRRRLQDRFVEAIGHGMNEEIARQRVLYVKELLTRTKHKLSTVAAMAGFGNVSRLNGVFQRETGMTPFAYRQAYSAR